MFRRIWKGLRAFLEWSFWLDVTVVLAALLGALIYAGYLFLR